MVFGNNKTILRHFQVLLVIFAVVIVVTGVVAYSLAAVQLKQQLVLKCQALAATVAAVIAEDSDDYAEFVENQDMEKDYYRSTKALMMKIRSVNQGHVEYIYTTRLVDEHTTMYIIGGEDPSSPVYTAPGVKDAVTKAERAAHTQQRPVMGEDFENTTYGRRLSAYHPIFHKRTGEFLGVVGADIISEQYNSLMRIFVIQTVVSLITGLTVFGLATYWLSGKVNLIVNRQRYAEHQARQKLATENAALERVSRMKTDLMATISHEARTPLAVLASYAGLVSLNLKHKGIDSETAADLDKVVSEATRVADLIDSMQKLTLSDGEVAARVPLDVGELIRQVARLYRPLLERKGVDLHLFLTGDYPVFGNPEELTQVIFNLVQNAKDHTERGNVSIRAVEENGHVIITVSDTGCGIPPELLPRLFEPGVKGDSGGAGLGLSICRDIIVAHGGTITLEVANGTIATVTLPKYREESDDDG